MDHLVTRLTIETSNSEFAECLMKKHSEVSMKISGFDFEFFVTQVSKTTIPNPMRSEYTLDLIGRLNK